MQNSKQHVADQGVEYREDLAGSPVFSNKMGFGSLQARDSAGCC